MSILVDSSIWIDFFKSGKKSSRMESLIDDDLIATNDIILAELIPFLMIKKQVKLVHLLQTITRLPLQLDWQGLIEMQIKCVQKGSNGIGIPDLIIAQNARQNDCQIYTLDKHFHLIARAVPLRLI